MNQSCALYANYYWLQICIHRPFIQPSKANRLPFPSLTICTNAARSATHVMETQFQKNGKCLLLNRVMRVPLSSSSFEFIQLTGLWVASVIYLRPRATLQLVGRETNGLVQRSGYGGRAQMYAHVETARTAVRFTSFTRHVTMLI